MSIAVSTLGAAGLGVLYGLASPGSAVSPAAESIQHGARSVVSALERSQALFGTKASAISDLWKLANECADAGWDGSDAAPINLQAVHNAVAFIRALPGLLPLPEFAPEPDGAVSLDWIVSRNRLFSVSVNAGASGRLAYAWLDGADRGHAVARFDGTTIPARILDGIRAITAHGNSAVRSR